MTDPQARTSIDEMSRLLAEAAGLLHQAVDVGASARDLGPEVRRAVDREWEEFLGGLIQHLKQRGRERRENLLAGISFSRVLAGGK